MVALKCMTDTATSTVESDRVVSGTQTVNAFIVADGQVMPSASAAAGEDSKTISSRVRGLMQYPLVGSRQLVTVEIFPG